MEKNKSYFQKKKKKRSTTKQPLTTRKETSKVAWRRGTFQHVHEGEPMHSVEGEMLELL